MVRLLHRKQDIATSISFPFNNSIKSDKQFGQIIRTNNSDKQFGQIYSDQIILNSVRKKRPKSWRLLGKEERELDLQIAEATSSRFYELETLRKETAEQFLSRARMCFLV